MRKTKKKQQMKYNRQMRIKVELNAILHWKFGYITFSHPSGGKRAKNRFIRGDASDTLSSGDVL